MRHILDECYLNPLIGMIIGKMKKIFPMAFCDSFFTGSLIVDTLFTKNYVNDFHGGFAIIIE